MVGTNQGNVHRQRQGTGLATTLGPRSRAVEDFIRLDDAALAARKQAEQARAAKQQDARKKMLDFNPERWFKHEVDIRKMQEDWVNNGANIMNAGTDPFSSTSPEAMQWRKRKDQIEAYAEASTQIKELHKQVQQKINGSEADKYDPETIAQFQEYFEKPIEEIVEKGILPPSLLQRKPSANLQKSWVGLVSDLQSRKGPDAALSDAERWDFIQASMSANPDLNEAAESYIANLPVSAQQEYKDRSQREGRSVIELVHHDFMKRYERGRDPFDLDKFIQGGADSIDIPYSQFTTPDKFGTYVDKKEFGRIAKQRATVMLTSSPEGLYEYQKLLPMKNGESEGDYRIRAINDLAKRMQELKATKSVSGLTDKGQGARDQVESSERWLKDIKSGDMSIAKEAAGYLFQTKDIFGLTVDKTEIIDNPVVAEVDGNVVTNPLVQSGRSLVLTLKGRPDLKEVTKKIFGDEGISEDVQYTPVGANSQLVVPITSETENRLLRLHDKAFKDTRIKYGGPRQETKIGDLPNSGSTFKF